MAIQDLTTFTEVDPNNRWAQTSTRNTYTAIEYNDSSYIYKDYGVDFFDTITQKIDFEITNTWFDWGGASVGLWAVTDTPNELSSLTEGLVIYIYFTSNRAPKLYVKEVGGVSATTYLHNWWNGDKYFALIERTGASFTVKVYLSDSDRTNNTNILATLNPTITTTDKFRYLQCGMGSSGGWSDVNVSGYVENFDVEMPSPEVAEYKTLTISDDIAIKVSQENVYLNDTIILGAGEYTGQIVYEDKIEGINLTDEIKFQLGADLHDNIVLCERRQGGFNRASNASKILFHDGYLYITTNENPAQLVKVNLDKCGDIEWITSTFNQSGEDLRNITDATINDTSDYLYMACADGKIVKCPLSDIENRETIVIESNTDNMTSITTVDDLNCTYIGTDNASAEMYKYEDCSTVKVSTRFDFLKSYADKIATLFHYIKGKLINLDFRFFHVQKNKINTDFRFSPYTYDNIVAIARTDFEVKIDGVIVDDVILPSITVNHVADNVSSANFILTRYYDKPDYTIEGGLSQISNKNAVTIYLKGHLIFSGNIVSFEVNTERESIEVLAQSAEEWSNNRTTKNIPIPSKNEQLHLYHAQVKSINIEEADYTKGVTTFVGLTCNAGDKLLVGTGFTSDMLNEIIDITGGTNFLPGSYEIVNFIDTTQVELDRVPTLKSRESNSYSEYLKGGLNGVGCVVIDNNNYRGVKVDLGESEEEIVFNSASITSPSALALQVETGSFKPQPNMTYFWFASGMDLITGRSFNNCYLGTGLAPIYSGLYYISGLRYKKQHTYDNHIIRQGSLYLGDYPYNDVGVDHSKYKSKLVYEDKENGLYWTKSKQYDYIDYAKAVANLEYDKIKNINGNLSPTTNADVNLTLDGFIYYNIALLTRVNVTNTTQANIYKNTNGFPLSVKNIEISANDMKAHLTLDNQKSAYELELIDGQYPDKPTASEEQHWKLNSKFNLPTFQNIQ